MKKLLTITFAALAITVAIPAAASAAGLVPNEVVNDPTKTSYGDVLDTLTTFIQFGLAFAAAVGMVFVVISGYQYILAAGNPEKLEKAKMGLTWSIVGFILSVSSYAIVILLQTVLQSKHKVNDVPGIGPATNGNPTNAAFVISHIAEGLFILGGGAAVLFLILGGFRYVTSQGDPDLVEKAKKNVLYAVIGLVVLFASSAIIAATESTIKVP